MVIFLNTIKKDENLTTPTMYFMCHPINELYGNARKTLYTRRSYCWLFKQ